MQVLGTIRVFAGDYKTDDNVWILHSKETLTSMLRTALINATRGDLTTKVPLVLKEIDFSNFILDESTYYVKCWVETDSYSEMEVFVTGIPEFEFEVEETYYLKTILNEFYLN